MIYRYEEKHLINLRQYEILKKRVEKLLKIDNHVKQNNEYLIRSIYFDDYIKKSVSDNIQGLKERYKYRLRLYNFNLNFIKLEKKVKNNEQGYKESINVSKEEYFELINGNYQLLSKREETLAKEFVLYMKTRLLKPLIAIEYIREPFVLSFNDIRITFDKNITYSTRTFFSEKPLDNKPVLDEIVLEIKYNHFFPNYLRKIFFIDSIHRMSISKYLICYKHSLGEEIQI